ncbi:MAG: hypothetical protein QOF84_6515 [Streptomyces sp.]|jgi:hypothetical protein|nr:hypothetical protein [Streptomyces sp.]
MSSTEAVNLKGVEGVPSMVVRAMGQQWYKEHLAGMDPLRGQRPDGASVAYVTEMDSVPAATEVRCSCWPPRAGGSRRGSWMW